MKKSLKISLEKEKKKSFSQGKQQKKDRNTNISKPTKRNISYDKAIIAKSFYKLFKKELGLDLQEKKSKLPEADNFIQSEPRLLGIMSRCNLRNHDVHMLDSQDRIIMHFLSSENVPPEFSEARNQLKSLPPSVVSILIYDTHLEKLKLDGSTEKI